MKKRIVHLNLVAALMMVLTSPLSALAGEQDAIRICEDQIRNVYGVNDFRNVSADKVGHHKFKVHGKVKYHGNKHHFNCKVKNGYVKSYHYDGPHAYSDKDDDHVDNKALAVGAGLAIVGALVAASLADKDSGSQPAGDLKVEKTVLEDECHDELSYRMRDEHHHRADVRIQTADLQGRNMKGKGKVVWDNHRADHFSYTCYFNGQGRVHDSSYHLY